MMRASPSWNSYKYVTAILSGDPKLLDTLVIILFYSTYWLENIVFLNHTRAVTIFDLHTLLNQVFWLSRSMTVLCILLLFYTKNNRYLNHPVSTSGLKKYQNMFNTVEMHYTIYTTKLHQSFTFFSSENRVYKASCTQKPEADQYLALKLLCYFISLLEVRKNFSLMLFSDVWLIIYHGKETKLLSRE